MITPDINGNSKQEKKPKTAQSVYFGKNSNKKNDSARSKT